jgi:transcriptional regulator with XRE-family HTH domain
MIPSSLSLPKTMPIDFVPRLQAELERRTRNNSRYSLRAFAQFLGTDHASLSQMLRERRPVPAAMIEPWCAKLGLSPEEGAMYARSDEPWAIEAAEIVHEPAHWDLICLMRRSGFLPDCRFVSDRLSIPVDKVNLVITRLLRVGMLRLSSATEWKESAPATEQEFRQQAISRIRNSSTCPTP